MAQGFLMGQNGGTPKLFVYAQPDLPTDKFDGILLQTTAKETLKKVIFDDNPWAEGQWQNPSLAPNLPEVRYGAPSCIINDEVYMFGGTNATSHNVYTAIKYNAVTKSYTTLATVPYACYQGACASIGSKAYIFGGLDEYDNILDTAYVYDSQANTYSQIHKLPQALMSMSAISYNGFVYLFGGHIGMASSDVIATVYRYDPSTDTYTQMASMNHDRGTFGATLYNGDVYVFAGSGINGNTNTAEKYSITNNTWTNLSNTCPASMIVTASILVGNKIIIFGIEQGYLYDPSADTYTAIESYVRNLNISSSAMVGNTIYFFGGYPSYASVESYMLTSKQYDYSPAMVIYRLQHDTTLQAILSQSKLCDGIPTNFKDAMLFKDGNLTFPALYVGNGTQWNLERSAQ